MLKGRYAVLFISGLALVLFLLLFPKSCEGEEKTEAKSEEEARIEALCSAVEGVGECRVMVTYEKSNGRDEERSVYSVAVICEGADSVAVRARLTELITSLYGIGSNRVSVIKLEK